MPWSRERTRAGVGGGRRGRRFQRGVPALHRLPDEAAAGGRGADAGAVGGADGVRRGADRGGGAGAADSPAGTGGRGGSGGRREGGVGCHEGGGGEGSVSEPNSSTAGSSVRSRMNSSTNTGVWSSAYVLRACSDRPWYRSPRNGFSARVREVVHDLAVRTAPPPEREQRRGRLVQRKHLEQPSPRPDSHASGISSSRTRSSEAPPSPAAPQQSPSQPRPGLADARPHRPSWAIQLSDGKTLTLSDRT